MQRRKSFGHLARHLALWGLLACSAGQTFAAGCASPGAQAQQLQRQISSNLSLARRHECASAGAAFACREIAGRVSEARAQLGRLAPVCPVKAAAASKPAAPKRAVSRKAANTPASPMAAGQQTMCVRLADGYYFPTPHSGFQTTPIDRERLNEQCRFICETDEMDVFVRTHASGAPQDMVSLTTGRTYGALPQAGLYRKAEVPKTCNMGRLSRAAILSSRAVSGGLRDDETAAMGVSLGPSDETVGHSVLFADVSLRGTTTDVPPLPRKVRHVGPTFLPAL